MFNKTLTAIALTAAVVASAASAPAETPNVSPDYKKQLSGWLESHKHYPDTARQNGEQGIVGLHFRVDHDGQVRDYAVTTSSGFADLDQSVRDMMHNAVLPSFPPSMTSPDIEVSVNIRFDFTPAVVTTAQTNNEWKMPYSEGCSPDGRSCVYNPHARGPYIPPCDAACVAQANADAQRREAACKADPVCAAHKADAERQQQWALDWQRGANTLFNSKRLGCLLSSIYTRADAIDYCQIPDNEMTATVNYMGQQESSLWVQAHCVPRVPRGYRCEDHGYWENF